MDVAEAVARARAMDPHLGAILRPTYAAALARDAALTGSASPGPLHRMPYTLKDVWHVGGLPTTHGAAGSHPHSPPKKAPPKGGAR